MVPTGVEKGFWEESMFELKKDEQESLRGWASR